MSEKTTFNYSIPANIHLLQDTFQINKLHYHQLLQQPVYDLTGRKVVQLPRKSYAGKATINLGNLNNGIYLLQIKQQDKSITKKIIIQK